MNYFFTRSSLLFLISFSFSVKKSFNVVIVLHCLYSSVYNTINVIIYASERERESRVRFRFRWKRKEKKNQFDRIEFISYVCVCIYIYTLQKKKRILSSRNAMTRHDTNIESNRIKANRRRRSDCNYFPPPFFLFSSPLFIVVLTLDPFPIYRYSRKLIDIFRLKKYFSQPIES